MKYNFLKVISSVLIVFSITPINSALANFKTPPLKSKIAKKLASSFKDLDSLEKEVKYFLDKTNSRFSCKTSVFYMFTEIKGGHGAIKQQREISNKYKTKWDKPGEDDAVIKNLIDQLNINASENLLIVDDFCK